MVTEKRYSHDGVVIIDHLKKDLIHIDGDENLLDLAEYVDRLQYENEQLKKEKQRMINKLNELALEFLNYNMVTIGKATEISEMCYSDFLKYRKDNEKTMELQL